MLEGGPGSHGSPPSSLGPDPQSPSVPVPPTPPSSTSQVHAHPLQRGFSQPPHNHTVESPAHYGVGTLHAFPAPGAGGQGPQGPPPPESGLPSGYGPGVPGLGPPGAITASVAPLQAPPSASVTTTSITGKRTMPPHAAESPAKKQSKWSPDEDALIIELRGRGMKWEDISKKLPGRSPISCRLHYQNYLERRSEWDEERKNKLARMYERFKPEMWAKIAEEMAVPWRAAEAMHWQLGELDMARRAGVTPFSLDPSTSGYPRGPGRPPHTHAHSQGGGVSRPSYKPHQPPPPRSNSITQSLPQPLPYPIAMPPNRKIPGSGCYPRPDGASYPSNLYARAPPAPHEAQKFAGYGLAWPPTSGSTPASNDHMPPTSSPSMAHVRVTAPPQVRPEPAKLPPLSATGGSVDGDRLTLPPITNIIHGAQNSHSAPAQSSGVSIASPVQSTSASPGPLIQPAPRGVHAPQMSHGHGGVLDSPTSSSTGKRRASPEVGRDAIRRRREETDPRRM